jgi:hypothetical protein
MHFRLRIKGHNAPGRHPGGSQISTQSPGTKQIPYQPHRPVTAHAALALIPTALITVAFMVLPVIAGGMSGALDARLDRPQHGGVMHAIELGETA